MKSFPRLLDIENSAFDPHVADKMYHIPVDDPYPVIQGLLAKGTVHEVGYRDLFTESQDSLSALKQYTVLGYDTVMRVLTDPATFTNWEAFRHTLGVSFGRSITVMDPPEHTRYRRIFQKAFLPQTVTQWGSTVVDPVVESLMGSFLAAGKADLVHQFTLHYPFQVIYRQLQLDAEQAPIFHRLAMSQLLSAVGIPEAFEATGKLGDFFQELLDFRRADPKDDLVSHLATVEVDGELLPDEVVISFLRQLMTAAGDTTYRGTSVLLTGLLTHPDQFAALVENRDLLPQAIEEALRWEGPVLFTIRHAARDAEIDGVVVPKGSLLNVMLGSANRDPAKFNDPDRFDIFRERPARPLPFSSGPHVCIGQHLARVEMSRAMTAILDRMPNLRLDPDMPPPDIRGHMSRVPEHIHVLFDPR